MANLNNILKVACSGKVGDPKTLSQQEEMRLGAIIQSEGSTEVEKRTAVERLVMKNIYLVLKITHKYKRKEFEFEDLVSYGILGLFKAATKYDPTRQNRFASYARHWIKESIMKAINEYSGRPKIPVYLVKDLWCVSRILSQNDNLDDITLAERANISIESAAHLRSLLFKFVPFDSTYSEVVFTTPEDELIRRERDAAIIEQLKKCLTPEQFTVIMYSCGLCEYPKMKFKQITKIFKIENPRRVKLEAMHILSKNVVLEELYKEGLE